MVRSSGPRWWRRRRSRGRACRKNGLGLGVLVSVCGRPSSHCVADHRRGRDRRGRRLAAFGLDHGRPEGEAVRARARGAPRRAARRCVSSCTAALSLALRIAGGRPRRRGPRARDDVHRDGERGRAGRRAPGPRRQRARAPGLIDLDAAEAAITPRTRAIMPVHLAGRPVDLDRPRRPARPARPHRHRGRGARDGHAVERPRRSARTATSPRSRSTRRRTSRPPRAARWRPTTCASRARSSGSPCTGSASAPGSATATPASATSRSRRPASSRT